MSRIFCNDLFRSLALLILFFVSTSSFSKDNSIDKIKESLQTIVNTAKSICQTVSFEGHNNELVITGQVTAELSELLKKFANAGVEGAIKYQTGEYFNVLQKDLAQTFKDGNDCRLKVFMELKDKLVLNEEDNTHKQKVENEIQKLKMMLQNIPVAPVPVNNTLPSPSWNGTIPEELPAAIINQVDAK